ARCRAAAGSPAWSAGRSVPWSMPPSGQVAPVSSLISLSRVELCLQPRHLLAQRFDLGAHCRRLAHDVFARAIGAGERVLACDLGHDVAVALRRGVPILDQLLLLLAPSLALVHERPFRAPLEAGVAWELEETAR